MIKNSFFSFLIFILFVSINYLNAQSVFLNIHLKDGSQLIFNINAINKIILDPITNIEDAKKINSILNTFKLNQNFPNPFNPNTSIQYEVPKAGKVELDIFNINGQLIKSIHKEHRQKGKFKIDWNGKNNQGSFVATGVYFYRAKFENTVISKRMFFIK